MSEQKPLDRGHPSDFTQQRKRRLEHLANAKKREDQKISYPPHPLEMWHPIVSDTDQ